MAGSFFEWWLGVPVGLLWGSSLNPLPSCLFTRPAFSFSSTLVIPTSRIHTHTHSHGRDRCTTMMNKWNTKKPRRLTLDIKKKYAQKRDRKKRNWTGGLKENCLITALCMVWVTEHFQHMNETERERDWKSSVCMWCVLGLRVTDSFSRTWNASTVATLALLKDQYHWSATVGSVHNHPHSQSQDDVKFFWTRLQSSYLSSNSGTYSFGFHYSVYHHRPCG